MTKLILWLMDPFAEFVVACRENRQIGQGSKRMWLTFIAVLGLTMYVCARISILFLS